MKAKHLVFVEPGKVELQEYDLEEKLEPLEVLVRTEYTITSAGTEGAGFTGLVKEMPFSKVQYPHPFGYCNLGEALAVGSGVTMCKVGDRVLTFGRHGTPVKVSSGLLALPVPKDVDGKRMVLARMAGISMSAVRSSTMQIGDTVLVIGAGLIGNFAAQLFQLGGADVMVADLSDFRLQKARECGLMRTVNPGRENLTEAVMEWTGGKGAFVVVDAVGSSQVINDAVMLVRRYGELILLGSPRARANIDVTPMLFRIHIEAIRLIGSLEWRWPIPETDRVRNMQDNYRLTSRWTAEGKLIMDPLITQIARPEEGQVIYEGLTQNRDQYLGCIFDWRED